MRSWVATVGSAAVLVLAGIGLAGGPAPAATAATKAPAGVVDLGKLSEPRRALSGKVYDLAPGGTLRLVVAETQTEGLGEISTRPKAAGLQVKRTVLAAPAPAAPVKVKAPARATEVEYRISLPIGAKPGRYEVRAQGRSPASALGFEIRVKPQATGEPRPL